MTETHGAYSVTWGTPGQRGCDAVLTYPDGSTVTHARPGVAIAIAKCLARIDRMADTPTLV